MTAPSDAVWGGAAVPYLRAVVDDVPAAAHRPWHAVLSVDTLRDALNGDARTMVGRRLEAIDILVRDASGRAASLGLRGDRVTTVRGDVLRAVVNQRFGDRTLPSTRFTLRREGRYYRFEGLGLGHGVGLCQRGAAARVSRGEGLGTILQTYYPGARLMAALTGAPRP